MKRVYGGATLSLAVCFGLAAAAAPPRPASADVKKRVAAGNTRFALRLYDKLREKEGNLFFSPLSVSTALAMTSAGARDTTLRQMQEALQFPAQDELHSGMSALMRSLNAAGRKAPGSELHVANAVWGQEGHPFLPEFSGILGGQYLAPPQLVDFSRDARRTQQAINAWVNEQTRGWIKQMPLKVDSDTRMLLASAIYFKGTWQRPFDPKETRDGTFRLARNKTTRVAMMRQHGKFLSCDDKVAQVLELPFAGKRLSMLFLLPRGKGGLPELEKRLNPDRLERWLGKLKTTDLEVVLPRFKAQSNLDLKGPLASLGIRDAFEDGSDFSGIDGTRDLFLGAVQHQAVVEVGEKGATAAAVTGTKIRPRGGPAFRADEPFLFLIRDRETGSLLFLGRLGNPR